MIKKITFISFCFGLILVIGAGAQTCFGADNYGDFQQGQSSIGLDIYEHIYENAEKMIVEKAVDRTVEDINRDSQIQYEKTDIENLLDNDAQGVIDKLKEIDPNISGESLLKEIFPKILREYKEQKEMADYETKLQIETGTLGMYSNGSLNDSDYDIVVDLNKIDIIYFGEQATLPVAYWATYQGTSATSSSSSSFAYTHSPSFSLSESMSNPILSNNENPSSVCPDSRTFEVTDPQWQETIDEYINTARNGDENTNQNGTGANQNTNNNDNSNINTNNNISQPPPADSGFTSQKDEEGGPNWPCTSFFCIKISMEKGGQTKYPKSDNSFQAHTESGLDSLKTTNTYPVHLRSTTRGFFSLGSIAKNFSEKLHLKVVIIKKPVWTPKPHTYSNDDKGQSSSNTSFSILSVTEGNNDEDEKGQVAIDVESAINNAQDRDPTTGEVNVECDVQAAQSFVTDTVNAEEQLQKQRQCQTERENRAAMQELLNKMEPRSKNVAVDLVPWERETQLMLGHIKSLYASMQEVLEIAKELNKKEKRDY